MDNKTQLEQITFGHFDQGSQGIKSSFTLANFEAQTFPIQQTVAILAMGNKTQPTLSLRTKVKRFVYIGRV